jgi:hypothetical protein
VTSAVYFKSSYPDKFMSYDLFFLTPSMESSSAEFNRYFAQRPNFSMKDRQAWYQNDDTGVYFSFEHVEHGDEPAGYWVQFNINYARPRFFALEALPEVVRPSFRRLVSQSMILRATGWVTAASILMDSSEAGERATKLRAKHSPGMDSVGPSRCLPMC